MYIIAAASVAADGNIPAYCNVVGTLTTEGDGAGRSEARVDIKLPATWNRKFLFVGVGGMGGSLTPTVNLGDYLHAIDEGYAIAVTDTGHQGADFDASWALIDRHVPDEAKLIDFWYRAAHLATVAGKKLVEAFYADHVQRSYFDGCSNGGRMALMEAVRYPDDYDAVIAGAPLLDMRELLSSYKNAVAFVRTPINSLQLRMISAAVLASCDSVDGGNDGLIQNPARCSFDPAALICTSGESGQNQCLTSEQVKALKTYISSINDVNGSLLDSGFPVSDLNDAGGFLGGDETTAGDPGAFEPWNHNSFTFPLAWWLQRLITRYVTNDDSYANSGIAGFFDPVVAFVAYRLRLSTPPFAWRAFDAFARYIVFQDPLVSASQHWREAGNVVPPEELALFDERTQIGDVDDPARFAPFLAQGKKIILYHGFGDPTLSPFRTILFYEALARHYGGYRKLQQQVRLFMVPGMLHCRGGRGPNEFDALSQIEAWSERGIAPNEFIASHFPGNDPRRQADRTMPICVFPGWRAIAATAT